MQPPMADSGEASEKTLMRVLTGILEDSVQSLQRIEKAVNESTKIARSMLEKLDLIDKKLESGFVAVVKKALPSLEQKFSDQIDKIGSIGDVTTLLPNIINKLQQSMQILTIQNLLDELDKVPSTQKQAEPKKQAKEKKPSKEKPAPPQAPVAGSPQEVVAQIKENEKKKEKKEEGEDHLLRPSSFFGS
ncbi:MAG: hypothetical protein ACTSQI_06355 [Candidatus Helarchaeota archaeon]